MNGFGHENPPLKEHVIVYFMGKGLGEKEALAFFDYYDCMNWRGERGRPILNWKRAAWYWILKIESLGGTTDGFTLPGSK